MTRKITNLKFWGRPMQYEPTGDYFWIRPPDTFLIIHVFGARDGRRAHSTVRVMSELLFRSTGNGVKSARTAAQNWYRKYHAALGREMVKR